MRKLASLILALALGLTAVPLTFSVSAAEDPESPKQKISDSDLAAVLFGKTLIEYKAGSGDLHIPSGDLGYPYYWSGEDTPDKVFDGNRSTTKIGGETHLEKQTRIITWETENAATPAYLVLFAGHDTGDNWGDHRNPVSFELFGYTSDGTEVPLVTAGDEMTNQNCYPTGWKIDTDKTFVSYKLECVTGTEKFQLEEIELYTDEDSAKPSDSGLTKDRYDISSVYNKDSEQDGNAGIRVDSGMLDGNLWFNLPLQFLTGGESDEDMLKGVEMYANGVKTSFNLNNYTGERANCGFTYSKNGVRGLWVGAVNGKVVNGTNTLTLLFGSNMYYEYTFNSNTAADGVESSNVTYFTDANRAEAVVTFADDVRYQPGDTVKARIHDEHNESVLSFEVKKVDGRTVTFVSSGAFITTHTMLEFQASEHGNAFSVIIDSKSGSNTKLTMGYLQTRDTDPDDGVYDIRILAESHKDFLASYKQAEFKVTLTLEDGSTVTYTNVDKGPAYSTVTAKGEKVSASADCGFMGVVITDVPVGTKLVNATVALTAADGSVEEIALGVANPSVSSKKVDTSAIRSKTQYSADKITAYADDEFDLLPEVDTVNHEDASSLFDGTLQKMCKQYGPIYFKTDEAIAITGLVFVVGNDTTNDAGNTRTFLTWELSGWDEAAGKWVRVASSGERITDGQSNYNGGDFGNSIDGMLERFPENAEAFAVEGAGSYSQYRLSYTRNRSQTYTQMAELMLYTD